MSNKDNLLNAGKKRALPPKTRNIPEATDLPLSEDDSIATMVVEPKVNEKVEKKPASKEQSKTKAVSKDDKETKSQSEPTTSETPVEPKRGPGKPKKRKAGDRKISFYLDEELVPGLFNSLGYGDSAGEMINIAIREYQHNHKIL